MNARPFLRWPGGKNKLADDILSHIGPRVLARRKRCFEPFVGGAALFWRLAGMGQGGNAVLSDANAELVTTYRALRDQPALLIDTIGYHDEMYRAHGGEYYYDVRAQRIDDLTSTAVGARMIFLNKTCFNGLYRVNRKGVFNVPHGRAASGKPPVICDAENLRACSAALQGVLVLVASFDAVMRGLSPTTMPAAGDLVYLDPPYEPEPGKKSFTAYTAGGASPTLQEDVARTFRELDARGVYVVASNSNTPRVRELYSGFRMVELSRSGGINSDTKKRQPVPELLILGRGCA